MKSGRLDKKLEKLKPTSIATIVKKTVERDPKMARVNGGKEELGGKRRRSRGWQGTSSGGTLGAYIYSIHTDYGVWGDVGEDAVCAKSKAHDQVVHEKLLQGDTNW